MNEARTRILLVEPEPVVLERVLRALIDRFDAQITCVPTAEECLEIEEDDPHDLVITEIQLPDMDGLDLTQELLARRRMPIILLADNAAYDDAVDALRLGATDLFAKPFPVSALLESVDRGLEGGRARQRHRMRYHQMRKLLRHVLRERRDLNERIELICRDFVGAHRRLVDRVVKIEPTNF
jgi:DNA-binding NtrC family response regulator